MSKTDKLNKLLKQIPEKIREEISTYPEAKWKYCINSLKHLPDVLNDGEPIVDFNHVEKIENNDKDASTFGVVVLTDKRIVFVGANSFFQDKEYMAFPFEQIRTTSCTNCSLIIQVANSKIEFDGIDEPLKYMEAIKAHLQTSKANSANDFMRNLRELADLKREGLLSDEEFALAKKKLLQ